MFDDIVDSISDKVSDKVDSVSDKVSGIAKKAKQVGGFIKEDVGNLYDKITETPEEKKEREAKEKEKQEKEKAEKEAAEKAEKERLKMLQKSYILHTAMITCSKSNHASFVVIPISHGEFIQGIPQLNIKDSKPNINIRTFGVCNSPNNPAVQAAANKILEEVNKREKSFSEKVMSIFTGDSDNVAITDEDKETLISQCVGPCTPMIFTDWIDGNEDVLVDGSPALMGRCKLMCAYGGEIKLYTSGQYE